MSNSTSTIERYVPVGNKSLISDAPGWNSAPSSQQQQQQQERPTGPTCWKCKGRKRIACNNNKKKMKAKKKFKMISDSDAPNAKKIKLTTDKNNNQTKECPVCNGRGYILPKKKERSSLLNEPGMITRRRTCPHGWEESGPTAHTVKQMKDAFVEGESSISSLGHHHPLHLLYRANCTPIDGAGVHVTSSPSDINHSSIETYPWYPHNHGEQLCNLVGNWRILQRTGSHRWTTDDIVTAYMGIKEALAQSSFQEKHQQKETGRNTFNYLDLGCGNASVLQMVSWGLWDRCHLNAFGIEARSEAVGLARRSLSFNVRRQNKEEEDSLHGNVHVVHGDFRDLNCSLDDFGGGSKGNNNSKQLLEKFHSTKNQTFDLVTGTPPYFRVDFSTDRSHDERNDKQSSSRNGNTNNTPNTSVTAAVIRQGGMPTSIQSAPARCEFRGGVEAYCLAAATILSDNGTFVVCENWLNDERVYDGARASGLEVVKVLPIKGKRDKKEILFGVYILKKKTLLQSAKRSDEELQKGGSQKVQRQKSEGDHVMKSLSVRTESGKWTKEYAEVLEYMSIPARHNVD